MEAFILIYDGAEMTVDDGMDDGSERSYSICIFGRFLREAGEISLLACMLSLSLLLGSDNTTTAIAFWSLF